jgi:transposase
VIPRRKDQRAPEEEEFDREAYRRRSVIECCIGWLKECRRVLTRFEKLAVNYLAVLKLAFLQRFLRILFPNRA